MTQAILVLPHLRIQNANAIGSPLTHGFPSITAFIGLMWALERKLAQAGVPLRLHGVGVVCHQHQEQTTQGYVRSFNLTRNPVDKDGSTAAIVKEGRMHLQITLVLSVSEKRSPGVPAALVQGNEALKDWAKKADDTVAAMRVAGGSVLPSRPAPGQRVHPWMAVVPDDPEAAAKAFRRWRRQWLPGFALVGRDDLLAQRLQHLRSTQPKATLLDAWLHAARFNHQALANEDGSYPPDGKVQWDDPLRAKGSGWIVPIPVGYAALENTAHPAGRVRNARDASVPLRFVESVYSLGQWIGPHRLHSLQELLWHAQTDVALGLYRCRSGYAPPVQDGAHSLRSTAPSYAWDDDEAYDYT